MRISNSSIALAVLLLLMLTGCAQFSEDRGMRLVQSASGDVLNKQVVAIRTEADAGQATAAVKGILRRPLTADAAVQIALLNNKGLQAAYNELGVAEATRIQASLPPNPTVSLA